MPRGRTESSYSLHERRQMAFSWFTQGYTDHEVAARLNVRAETVAQYRTQYEQSLAQQVARNPTMLRDVLENTVRALSELDEVRKRAWEEYESATRPMRSVCPDCEHEFIQHTVSSPTTRNALLGTITKAQEQRAKLLGLFGVKADFLQHVNSVRMVQEALLAFMRQELCTADKAKLEALMTNELADHFNRSAAMPPIPAELVEATNE